MCVSCIFFILFFMLSLFFSLVLLVISSFATFSFFFSLFSIFVIFMTHQPLLVFLLLPTFTMPLNLAQDGQTYIFLLNMLMCLRSICFLIAGSVIRNPLNIANVFHL